MTQDDYARYAAVMRRREASLTSTALYAGALLMAVPTALVFRSIGQHLASAPSDADLIGKCSLFAFMLGVLALVLAGAIARRLALRNYVKEALNALGSKTVILDATGVTVIGQVSQGSWRWAAISQLILERGLILLVIGGSYAFAIPDRSFEGQAARDAAIAFIRARLAETRSGSPPPA